MCIPLLKISKGFIMKKQKKICIVTFIHSLNFGAVLQAYALETFLKKHGYNDIHFFNYKLNKFASSHMGLAKKIFGLLFAKHRAKKKQSFLDCFVDDKMILVDDISKEDLLICGSDQVWNPDITGGIDNLFFGSDLIPSVAFSASCGDLESLKKNEKNIIEKLKKFRAISVRERDLKEYLKTKYSMPVELTCDPVFLLDKSEYDKIDEFLKIPRYNYLLIYQMSKNNYLYKLAYKIARKYHFIIIEINNNLFNYYFRFHKTFYSISIGDFLALFRHASFVVTNSFHGTAFSIIYEKQFFSIGNASRNSRLANLCETLDLTDRLLLNKNETIDFEKLIDYEKVRSKINEFATHSKRVLLSELIEDK